jgi:NADH-quinone oxidoreductase subunit M
MNFIPWFDMAPLPLLSLLTLLPLLGALAVSKVPSLAAAQHLALVVAALCVVLALLILHYVDPELSAVQLGERLRLGALGYTVGVDGSNVLFLPLCAILALLLLCYLRITPYAGDRHFLVCVLAYLGIMLGAFSALNLLQFWLWCALELLPLWWLVVRRGTGADRARVGSLLLRYFGAALGMILICFLLLAYGEQGTTQALTFDWQTLRGRLDDMEYKGLVFLLLFFAFAIRMPLFPFHAWLPLVAERGPVASVLIFTVGMKLGVYGMVRFILPLVPEGANAWAPFALTLGLISIFYGALLALMQINMRRLLAFAVLSHSGLLVVGVFSFSPYGLEGSILLSVAYGLATAGMVFSLGLIYQRTSTASIPRLGGLFDANTALGLLFLISALSTMVMPGTPGYDAAHLLLEGVIEEDGWWLAIVMLTGNLLAAAFLLRAFQQIFIVQPRRALPPHRGVHHRVHEEVIIAVAICTLLIVTGFYGSPELNLID